VSAIIIEDKIGLKKNSLFGTEAEQKQDTIENFSHKISQGKKAQVTDDFMIIARIESLILKTGLEDALARAKAYLAAGADGIMIHSKEKESLEILEFCKEYSKFDNKVPLVVVPSTYCHITETQLKEAGANIVIYANHLLRSAYPAMVKTAESILVNGRAHEASNEICMSIKEILNLIPGGK
jgi:phosphoenolpyruvate phosphomutase